MLKVYKWLLLACVLSVQADMQDYRDLFENKKVLITGGTGFIGRSLVEGILPYNPAQIIIFSRDEVKHYKVLAQFNDARIKSVIGDVRDYNAIYNATKGMDIVIHAAALKRIDMIEYHVYESIYTNVLGSLNVVKASKENKVHKILLVSTDKACMPINTYGACKFLAERLFTNADFSCDETTCVVVRYGNVLQSTGSVIPFFCEKIKNNETIPLTHKDMTRFFITNKQAVALIFKALKYGRSGDTFIPELPAFRIVDLIEVLQEMLGNKSDVKLVGLRPGEKIHEAMINSAEMCRMHKLQDVFIISPTTIITENVTTNIDAEYTSQGAVLPKERLKMLLEEHTILKEMSYEKTTTRSNFASEIAW